VRRFQAGEWVELREVWDGKTWEIRRGLVVRDEADVVAVCTPPSTRVLIAVGEDGVRLRLPPAEWEMAEAETPADRSFLAVHPAGAEHSVLVVADEEWRMLHWYINLESDLVRTSSGFEYEDHFLDVIVEADLRGGRTRTSWRRRWSGGWLQRSKRRASMLRASGRSSGYWRERRLTTSGGRTGGRPVNQVQLDCLKKRRAARIGGRSLPRSRPSLNLIVFKMIVSCPAERCED
jgi:hypothetical protein